MDDTFGDDGSGSEDDEKESEAPSFYEKDCILFVIDARQAMLAEPAPGEPPPLTQALRAVAATMRKRVLAGDGDQVGVMLFGTREKSAPEGLQSFDHTFVLLPMAEPHAAVIEKMQNVAAGDLSEFGHMEEGGEPLVIESVLWQISMLFAHAKPKPGARKRVFFLTNDDAPCEGGDAQKRAAQRAADLGDARIWLEPLFFAPPGRAFNLGEGSFWREALARSREKASQHKDSAGAAPVDGDSVAEAAGALSIPIDVATCVCADASKLEARLERAQHRRRSYATLAFRLGDVSAQTLSLKMVTVLKPFRPPTKQQLTAESNEEVRRISCTYDADHGTSVGRDELMKALDFGGSQQVFEPFEVASGKVAESLYGKDEPPLILLGFRPTEALKPHLNVKPATFLEPSETAAGSTVAARALVESMAAKGRIALARFRRQGAAQLVALLPQRREPDPTDPAVTKLPCGFHLVYLPFANAVRKPELPPTLEPGAFSAPQLEATRRLVQHLTLPEGGAQLVAAVPNPASEAHFRVIEQAAFSEGASSALQPVKDGTVPDAAWLGEPSRVQSIGGFIAAFGVAQAVGSGGGGGERAPKRLKASVPTSAAEWSQMQAAGRLAELSATVLKEYLRAEGLTLGGKKDDLVARVSGHIQERALQDLNAPPPLALTGPADGQLYTFAEFVEFYGEGKPSEKAWAKAKPQ